MAGTGALALAAVLTAILAGGPAARADNPPADPAEIADPQRLDRAERKEQFSDGVRAYDAGAYEHAYAIWMPLAKRGDLAAQRNVGHLLRKGLGTEKDPARALYFYERAAEGGLSSAALNAGMMYLNGEGTGPDPRAAAAFFQQAARQGYPEAMFQLARLYQHGRGIEADAGKADYFYRLAAFFGHPAAKAEVGLEERLDRTRAPRGAAGF